MRFCLLLAALAAASLSAQSFYSTQAPGFQHSEAVLPTAAPSSYLLHGGADWDPTGTDLYYWDVANGLLRRFDTLLNAPAPMALLTVPAGPFGFTYVDTIAFDSFAPDDLYIGESGNQVIHKVRRSGLDTLDASFGTGGVQTSAAYSFFLFDLKFDPFGRLLGSAANSFGTPECGVYAFNKNSLAATQVVNMLTTGGCDTSGPIAFDAAGNLYFAAPPTNYGDPMRLFRWTKAQLDAAINSAGAIVLTVANATILLDWADNFPAAASMGFRTEQGQEVLYIAAGDGRILRSVLSTRAYTQFATAAAPPAGETVFPSALAIESATAPFRPFSGDASRMAVVIGARDAAFDQVRHSIAFFGTVAAPATVASLAVSGLPTSLPNGAAFGATVELRDGAGALLATVNGAVEVAILSGSGSLVGQRLAVATNGVAIFDDLKLSGGSGSVILQFALVGGTATVNSATITIPAGVSGGSGSTTGGGSGGCSTGGGGGGAGNWLVLVGLVALLGLGLRVARRRA
ncbi:MAG: hypothetical protein IPP14_10085 [Planctomycetes bacterium]|nr:hypothetical protein [Planctomycetota bacterium]